MTGLLQARGTVWSQHLEKVQSGSYLTCREDCCSRDQPPRPSGSVLVLRVDRCVRTAKACMLSDRHKRRISSPFRYQIRHSWLANVDTPLLLARDGAAASATIMGVVETRRHQAHRHLGPARPG